jgi:hypothetical protein
VAAIAAEHHGSSSVSNAAGGGAVFELRLPLGRPGRPAPDGPRASQANVTARPAPAASPPTTTLRTM